MTTSNYAETLTPDENGVICCFQLDKSGEQSRINCADLEHCLADNKKVWVHMDATHAGSRKFMREHFRDLDDVVIDAMLASEARPRVTQFENGVMLILRGVNLNENSQPEDMISIRLWIDENRVISTRLRRLRAVVDMRNSFYAGNGPKTTGEFLTTLICSLYNRMEGVVLDLEESIDDLEASLQNGESGKRQEVIDTRQDAIILRRHIAPQKDLLGNLANMDLGWINPAQRRVILESQDRVTRYVEELDAIRERAHIVKDEISNIQADKLNRNTYMLSIVAAIFLPLGFLTGLLGINVPIPWQDNPAAFGWLSLILLGLIVVQILVFRWLKLF